MAAIDTSQESEPPAGFLRGDAIGTTTASLDSKLVHQTKSEIRNLAAEIAALATRDISKTEFFDGFLPRLKTAMGASATAVWRRDEHHSASNSIALQLLANHGLPSPLLGEELRPSSEHEAVLTSALAERKPLLVPPRTVQVDANRPLNPLDESIVLVPIRFETEDDHLLEVVLPASGGPTAQRGYLRFVVQMADLAADFLRRAELRSTTQQLRQANRTSDWLLRVAAARQAKQRYFLATCGLSEVLGGQQALLLIDRGMLVTKPRIIAVSGVSDYDPRSEIIELAERLVASQPVFGPPHPADASPPQAEACSTQAQWIAGGNTSLPESAGPSASTDTHAVAASNQAEKTAGEELCELLNCDALLHIRSSSADGLQLLAGFTKEQLARSFSTDSELPSEQQLNAAARKTASFFSLLAPTAALPTFSPRRSLHSLGIRTASGTRMIKGLILLLAIVASFTPVPQKIRATGIVHAVSRSAYYAPMNGIVEQVGVQEGDWVEPNQPLLRLTSAELRQQLDRLRGESRYLGDQIGELRGLRLRGDSLNFQETDRVDAELQKLESRRGAIDQQLELLEAQQDKLTILAKTAGRIATWDLQHRLLHRPVQTGQLLTTVFEPDGPWELQLALPSRRLGLIESTLQNQSTEDFKVPVQFHLTSHPERILNANLIKIASSTSSAASPLEASFRQVGQADRILATATFDTSQLPTRKDGALVYATIDCGYVPAVWLCFRDALWSISSRIKMMF